MRDRIIERTPETVSSFLTEEEFDTIRRQYLTLNNWINAAEGTDLTPNQRIVKLYDNFETILPGFLSRFYCITAKAYTFDLRKNVAEDEKIAEMKQGLIVASKYAEIDPDLLNVVYLYPSDKLKIVLKNVESGCYWLINKRELGVLRRYLEFVIHATDFAEYCATVRKKFLFAGLFTNIILTLRYPYAYNASPEELREHFPYWLA